ncbi:uncharacterized protein (DUF58 family) [Geomicrobium halophilum]|uniref:Uncharacterized protein (DUF58 family) n=1 Tax=Geomicrobium halophilum TaxID=549000 RepID=A0A841PPZ5_9BACL|nr:DUF58 domain-containing protein [Geomicrobium halophilum]MBB6450897.1 uncharacterized protein (DUF58 family) [Geomicrobium halophilum]
MSTGWQAIIAKGLRVFGVLLFAAALFVYVMVQGGFVSWFLFYSVSILLLIGLLFVIFPLRWLSIERSISNRHLAYGETAKVTIRIRKKRPWPLLFLGIQDIVPEGLRLESHPGAFFTMVISREKEYSYLVKAEKRGGYSYTHAYVETGDPFGFWEKEKQLPAPSEVLVYPRVPALPFQLINNRSRKLRTDGAGLQRASHEETSDFSSVREYVTGDRLSSIDWKVSARLGKLATKEFDTEEGKGFTILFDARTSDEGRFEAAVEWAAAVVNGSYEQNAMINFASIGGGTYVTSKGRDRSQLRQVMNALARLQPVTLEETTPFPQTFNFLQTIVFIAPQMNATTLKEIRQMEQQQGDVLVLYSDQEAAHLQLKQMGVKAYAMPTQAGRSEGASHNRKRHL